MDDAESATKFDSLVSTTDLNLDANLLTRVPSLKNMSSLRALYLESNKITRIVPGDVPAGTLVARRLASAHPQPWHCTPWWRAH